MITYQPILLRDLEKIQIEVRSTSSSSTMSQLNQVSVRFNLYDSIKKAQQEDFLEKIREKIQWGELKEFIVLDNVLKFGGRLCVREVSK